MIVNNVLYSTYINTTKDNAETQVIYTYNPPDSASIMLATPI